MNRYRVKSIFVGLVSFILVTMSLFQSPFDEFSKEQQENKKKYPLIIKKRNLKEKELLNELGKNLTIKEYRKALEELKANSKEELRIYTNNKRYLAAKHSFLGRNSFKFWIFQFGLITLGFYFAIKSLLVDLSRPVATGHEIISIIGVSICLFWFYHLFFQTSRDFFTETYLIFKVFISLGIGYFISKLIKYYTNRDGVIKVLIDLILRIKTKHYRKIAISALYAERYDKSIDTLDKVEDQARELDEDISKTINKIAI
ncbi:hypothetical protein [Tenacibaculum maritimum]|uniref:hypothetical protein n=2 Tax=Tenacibaculum maritimum TaxID=107401 RepID=UPI0012E4D020|nr:hypothetical protein [Tenacibaculum maritimum]CAA0186780.1 conserved membrane hypothetical protein [Tenacibaculum maritimum]CAA0221750.1 conserved membrane hypothetical protein [Tenacibaculum maritimum]